MLRFTILIALFPLLASAQNKLNQSFLVQDLPIRVFSTDKMIEENTPIPVRKQMKKILSMQDSPIQEYRVYRIDQLIPIDTNKQVFVLDLHLPINSWFFFVAYDKKKNTCSIQTHSAVFSKFMYDKKPKEFDSPFIKHVEIPKYYKYQFTTKRIKYIQGESSTIQTEYFGFDDNMRLNHYFTLNEWEYEVPEISVNGVKYNYNSYIIHRTLEPMSKNSYKQSAYIIPKNAKRKSKGFAKIWIGSLFITFRKNTAYLQRYSLAAKSISKYLILGEKKGTESDLWQGKLIYW